MQQKQDVDMLEEYKERLQELGLWDPEQKQMLRSLYDEYRQYAVPIEELGKLLDEELGDVQLSDIIIKERE